MTTTTNASENQTLDEMVTSYMNASYAAYETLEFLVDVCGEVDVLNELFDYMDVDKQVEFVHDFIRYNDVDTSEMNDETLRTINEHYKRHC
jgi:cell division FtsZ-interacting protein ZapD